MNEQLIGVWKLVSYETRKPDGSTVTPFGDDVRGLLIYTADGFMSGQVMKAGRPQLSGSYGARGKSEAAVAAFEGYIAYCGRWRVDAESGEVIHNVESSLYPNWVGSEQRRGVAFEDGELVLSAATERSSGVWISLLRWQRA